MTPEAVRRTRLTAVGVGVFVLLLAVSGAVAVVVVKAGFLVLRPASGSTGLDAGSLALTVPVDGRSVRPGDVVSLRHADGERFASRVVSATVRDDETTLMLQGDREPHVVHTAQRVEGSLPYAGYGVLAVTSPAGVVFLAAVLVVLGLLSPAAPELRGGRHRSRRRLPVPPSSVRSSLD